MTGIVVQLNVSPGGAPKQPIPEAKVSALGLEGDHNRCRTRKGDPENRRAVCLYPLEHISWLRQLGFPVHPGALGENITTQGIDYGQLRIGDILRVGDVELEITRVRTPCAGISQFGGEELARTIFEPDARENPASPKWGRSGFYAKVLKEGAVRPGDSILRVSSAHLPTIVPEQPPA
jgi:MOSC domain-containing protein YiiM